MSLVSAVVTAKISAVPLESISELWLQMKTCSELMQGTASYCGEIRCKETTSGD
jgi:hypothetical protein